MGITVSRAAIRLLAAVLCMAAMMVFAATALAGSLNAVQHSFDTGAAHEHTMFSGPTLDDHDLTPSSPSSGDDNPADHLAGHHHHADTGVGLIAPPPANGHKLALAAKPTGFTSESNRGHTRHTGPERPPKATSTDV